MVAENKDCALKSKLTKTVKALSKYNGRTRVATKQLKQTNKQTNKRTNRQTKHTNKQTQRHKNWKTFKQKNILTEQKNILKSTRTDRLTVDTRTHTHTHTHTHTDLNKNEH